MVARCVQPAVSSRPPRVTATSHARTRRPSPRDVILRILPVKATWFVDLSRSADGWCSGWAPSVAAGRRRRRAGGRRWAAAPELLQGGEGVVEGPHRDDPHLAGVALGGLFLVGRHEEGDRAGPPGGDRLLGGTANRPDPTLVVDGAGHGDLAAAGQAPGGEIVDQGQREGAARRRAADPAGVVCSRDL